MQTVNNTFPWESLLDVLRTELQEYGGLLGLLAEQQSKILKRQPEELLEVNRSVEVQMETSQKVLTDREELVARLAREHGQQDGVTLSEMMPLFPEETKPMFESLIGEINDLIMVARRKVEQNQNLLNKMNEVTSELLRTANPSGQATTYDRAGNVGVNSSGAVQASA